MGAEKVGEMPHQELAEFLRSKEVSGGRLAGDGQEDFTGWSEAAERGGTVADFCQDGDGVRELAEGEVGKRDGNHGVSRSAVVRHGRVAEIQDRRVGTIEPGLEYTEQFSVGVLGDKGRDGGREARRRRVIWVRGCHDAVCDFEISHIRSQGADDRA